MLTEIYVGIDVACARGKSLPICFVRQDGNRVTPLSPSDGIKKLIPKGLGNAEVRNEQPFKSAALKLADALLAISAERDWRLKRIAIDAPAAPANGDERVSERELRQCGLSIFQTPNKNEWQRIEKECKQYLAQEKAVSSLPNANRIWMLYGFEIFKALRVKGFTDIIEVFPYSIICEISPGCPHKSTAEGYTRQLKAISRRTGWEAGELENNLRCVPGRRHDKLDSFMAAWTASLPINRRRAYGDPLDQNDAIWVPDLRNAKED